jgi:outer membrane receptor protein involved in Fe transport
MRRYFKHSSLPIFLLFLPYCFLIAVSHAAPPITTDLTPQLTPTYDDSQLLQAPGLPLALADATGQVIVFKGQDIRQSGYMDITDFLERLPELFTERYYNRPGPVTKTFSQGAQPNNIAVFVDDFPVASLWSGIADLSRIPLEDIISVEVYPGSSALSCGGDGAGGTVRINTWRGRQERASSWLCFTDSTFDRERYKMDFGNSFSFVDMRIAGSREISTGWIRNARSRLSNISGYTRFFPEYPLKLTLAGNRMGRYQEMIGSIDQEELDPRVHRLQDELRYDLEGKLDWEVARSSNFSLKYLLAQEDRTLIYPRLLGSRDQGNRQETVLGYSQSWNNNGIFIETGLIERKSSGATNITYYSPKELIYYRGSESEPWAKVSGLWMPNKELSLLPVVKYSNVVDENRFDPGLNLGWQPVRGLMFYANGASTYHRFLPREQKVDDAPNISSALGAEVGVKARHPWRGEIGLSGYWRNEDNRPEEGSLVVHDTARFNGGGIWLSCNPWIPDLYLLASASVDNTQADGRELPMIPQQRVHTRLDYSLPFFDGDLRFGAAVETDFVGKRAYVLPNSDPLNPDYSHLGTYSLINFLGYIQLLQVRGFANFYNVTNNESRVIVPDYFSPGYEMAIGVTWQLFD